MNLLNICEPLFHYICRLNRIVRSGQGADYDTVRSDIKQIFATMAEQAQQTPRLSSQFKKMEISLMFFVDSIISESALPFAKEWNKKRLAFERNTLSGDEKFYDLLDDTMAEQTDEANERLAVYYTCIGIGFTGWYQTQPEYLRKKMRQLAPRILDYLPQGNDRGYITPEAYKQTNTANLPMPVSASVMPLVISLLALIILVGTINYMLFVQASSEMQNSLERIISKDPAVKPASEVRK